MHNKYSKLRKIISELDNAIIAFSGGIDSTFLLKVCKDVLGDKVIAVTATSSTYPTRELNTAKKITEELSVRHIVIESEELEIEGFSKNPIDRCYYCKKELYSKLIQVGQDNGITNILDGSNFDDMDDYRPGMKALKELNIKSPLKEVCLTKDEIRDLAKMLKLSTWNKPSYACLSSRFPYGEEITIEKLTLVDKAEQFLLDRGFSQVRVRNHGNLARIELLPLEKEKILDTKMLIEIGEKFKNLGYTYVTLDVFGYRTGSMNETLE
ncbi:MAG: potassium ABC transporter ATPase [Clostridiaceae bacterium BRH_c20a]|nr:MAG: potassium ABC transporter ATPase [Clostridiaceae bacterium BRH_c20a]